MVKFTHRFHGRMLGYDEIFFNFFFFLTQNMFFSLDYYEKNRYKKGCYKDLYSKLCCTLYHTRCQTWRYIKIHNHNKSITITKKQKLIYNHSLSFIKICFVNIWLKQKKKNVLWFVNFKQSVNHTIWGVHWSSPPPSRWGMNLQVFDHQH